MTDLIPPSLPLHAWPAHAMVTAFRAHALSPVEVTLAVLARIEQWEPQLNATYLLRPDEAIAQAQASETRWRRGEPLGVLDGVPFTAKDNIATRGDPMPLGTAAVELIPAMADAPPAARLRESGAVLIAKTTMPDYGMLSSGVSSFHALTRNPWDLSKGPGGSTAGGGAAAAAGYGPLHLGTDIGGSLRLPASWCGVFTLKPSGGRVPIDPPYMGRVAGPITRCVADAALAMQVLSQPDARDTMSLPWQDIAWTEPEADPEADAATQRLRGLRIGLLMDAGCGLPVESDVRDAVERAAKVFERAGAIVEPMPAFMTQNMLNGMDRFWRMRALIDINALPAERRARVLPFIRDWAEGASGMSGPDVFQALNQFAVVRLASVRACAGYDYVISPVAPMPAFDAELPSPTNDPAHPLEHIGFTVPYNMSEQPAASINCGATRDGLPVGLQIAGQRFDDLGVLQVARAFERLREPQRSWPEPEIT